MFIHDFKFDDLSKIVYNSWLKEMAKYPVPSQFFVVNFDDLTAAIAATRLTMQQ